MINECNNGYFQFSSESDGLYITVYPPKAGGTSVQVNEAMYYIDQKKLADVDIVKLGEAFKVGQSQENKVKVSDTPAHQFSEFGSYTMSSDFMSMEAVFYPPFEGASFMSVEEIVSDIEHQGVKFGIDRDVIQHFIDTKDYFKPFIVAKGATPREGTNGYIEYKFNTDLKPSPKMNDDGTVDFHTLENVNHINEGDVVAILHPEDRGEPGSDLLGRKVNPRKVNHVVFKYGQNLKKSEDGLELVTQVSGHVVLEGEKIFVSNVMELVDIDTSTGNINYDGSLVIKGNVCSGFSVQATGDIAVSGIVEGASVIAGGNVTLNRGVQGMGKAIIKAGGNIVSKFIESAENVVAGGNIESDSILHSKVMAKGMITASGKNGLIVGGDVKATLAIDAKTIGNAMGTATTVGVGVDPAMKKRVDELKKSLGELGDNKIRLNQILTALRKKQEVDGELDPDKKEMQTKTMRNVIMLEQELTKQKKELEEIRTQIGEEVNANIKVRNTAYVGTKLMFGDQCLFLKEKYTYCQFRKEKADIKSLAL